MHTRTYKYLRIITWVLILISIGMIMGGGEINLMIRKGILLLMSISATACALARDYSKSNIRKYLVIVAVILIMGVIFVYV